MISTRSLQYFSAINLVFTAISLIHYAFLYYSNFHFTIVFLTFVAKNTILLNGVQYAIKDKPYIQNPEIEREKEFDLSNFLVSAALESVTFKLAIFSPDTNIIYSIIFFIPQSFLFELVFDLFHYSSHRLMHTIPYLYKHIHSKHHEDNMIDEYSTFNHSFPDLLLTNILPILATFYIVRLSVFTGIMIFWYKTMVEISGHSGKDTSSSFSQCIYLPKLLGIELYPRNHLLHHVKPNVNFSKRFSIWDKLFCTFRPTDVSNYDKHLQ
jgi:sterol desaturase/sphingolipid hydroxylase (fatty acid hydroxylase superfamily)